MPKIKPITFDYSGSLIAKNGITQQQIDALKPDLIAARDEMLKTDLEMYDAGAAVPEKKQPLDAGFHEMPERCLLYTSPSPRDATLSRMPSSA